MMNLRLASMRFIQTVMCVLTWHPAEAVGTIVRCTASGSTGDTVVIALDTRKQFGRMLSCISGSFISDMEPCAPAGGYGLSMATGIARLASVGIRWQDLIGAIGGVTNYYQSPSELVFVGSFLNGDVNSTPLWKFNVNRLDGTGILVIPGKTTVEYACIKASKRF